MTASVDARSAPRRTARVPLAAAAAGGALFALQQRLNGELATRVDDALLAAVVSFATGLLAVAAVVLTRPSARRGLRLLRTVPWHRRLGGLGGAALVAVGAAAAPEIGVALLTVGLVAGQTTGGLVVDRLGLGPGGGHRLTAPRLLGAALCLVAVAISGLGESARSASPALLLLVVTAGFLIAVQQAFNGQVRRATGDASVATLVNFVVGLVGLLLGLALQAAAGGLTVADWPGLDSWWLYLGGPMGAVFIAVSAVVVRQLGVLRLGLAIIAGQVTGATVLDVVSPVHGASLDALTVVGVVLTLVAVQVSGRSRTP